MKSTHLWMYNRMRNGGLTYEFLKGVDEFIEFATSQHEWKDGEKIKCPCVKRKCRNKGFLPVDVVKGHLVKNVFTPDYFEWVFHGEQWSRNDMEIDADRSIPSSNHEMNEEEYSPYHEMVMDAAGPAFNAENIDEENPNPEAQKFFDMLEAADHDLWPGCSHSQLSFIARLMSMKSDNHMSEKLFNEVFGLVKELAPEENSVPDDFYKCKKLLRGMGLPVQKIDCCPKNCMIYWREDEELTCCKFCNEPRYDKKNLAKKIMYYFPLAPRLQRLYASKAMAKEMRWHANHDKDQGMEHPSDSEASTSAATPILSEPSTSAPPPIPSLPSTSAPPPIPSAPSTSAPPTIPSAPAQSTSSAVVNSQTTTKKQEVRIIKGSSQPGHKLSHMFREIVLGRVEKGATRWKKISAETKRIYFEEFKKKCVWSEDIDALVPDKWNFLCARRYGDIVHDWKKIWEDNNEKPEYMTDEAWASFIAHWQDPKEIAKAEQNKKNRRSEPAGEGTGISCHKGGSVGACEFAEKFAKKHKMEANEYGIFLNFHPPDENGKYAYAVAENVAKAIQQKKDDLSQMSDTPEINMGDIFRQTVDPKKCRIFGIGNLGKRSSSSQSSVTQGVCSKSECKKQLDEKILEVRTEMQSEIQALQAQVQQLMEIVRGGNTMTSPYGGGSTSGVGHDDIDADDDIDVDDEVDADLGDL